MLYDLLKMLVSITFNLLNRLLGGKLPPFGSAAVIVEDDNRYLVVQLPRRRVVFPGGYMMWNESPQMTAEREGKEETGFDLHVDELMQFYPKVSKNWLTMSNISFVFTAHIIGGALCNSIEGIPCWMSEDELRARLDGQGLLVLHDYLRYRATHHVDHPVPPESGS